jgi:hypothetical protein
LTKSNKKQTADLETFTMRRFRTVLLSKNSSFSMIQTNETTIDSTSNPENLHPKPAISSEIQRIQRRIEGFDWQESGIWAFLCWLFGPKLSQDELVSLGGLVARTLGIQLDRDARRRKSVMIKWFEEHWIEIQPLLWFVRLDEVEVES